MYIYLYVWCTSWYFKKIGHDDPSNLKVFLAKMLPAGTVRAKSSTRPAYCAFSLVPDREIEGIRVWEICQTYVNVLKKVN